MAIPYLIYCTPEGEIREEPRLRALAFDNHTLESSDLIPLPDGVTLSMMPDRLAVGVKGFGRATGNRHISRLGCRRFATNRIYAHTASCIRKSTEY